MNKKFSIITVVRNGVNTIEKAIKSVISQENVDIEYIVIDGKSTDGTQQILEKYSDKIPKWISETDNGIYDAMNKGIKLATGDVIAFLNSDDWYLNGALEVVAKQFSDESLDMLFANINVIDNFKTRKAETLSNENIRNNFTNMPVYHPSTFVKIRMFKKIGLYDTNYRIAADFDWIKRALLTNPNIKYLDRVTTAFSNQGVSSQCIDDTLEESYKIALKYSCGQTQSDIIEEYYRTLSKERHFARDVKSGFVFDLGELNFNRDKFIYIFGAGILGQECKKLFENNCYKIYGFIDNDSKQWGSSIDGTMIYSLEEIDKDNSIVIITVKRYEEHIKEQLLEVNWIENNIILYSDIKRKIIRDYLV